MEKQTAKRKWPVRLVMIALLCAILSTCLLSGVMAKYLTVGNGGGSGRVAKWGVAVAVGTDELFKPEYKNVGDDTIVLALNNVLAPGTSGTSASFTVSGTPEVACRVSIDATGSSITGWTVAGAAVYEPVLWTLKKGGTPVVAADGVDFATLLTAINAVGSAEYAAGTDLSAVTDFNYTVEWAWAFSSGAAGDANDTYLADKGTAPSVTFVFKITIEQINSFTPVVP